MKEEKRNQMIVGIQLAIALVYVFVAIWSEARAPMKIRAKEQKKLLKKARKQAFKEIRQETKMVRKEMKAEEKNRRKAG